MPRQLRNSLFLLLLFWAGPAWAEEGRIPIFEPVLITNTSGKFVVTRNITAAATKAIEINGTGVEEVDIDFNGFTVKSTADITISINNVKSAVIRNGSVICASANPVIKIVAAGAAGQAVLEDLTISGGTVGIKLEPVANFFIRHSFIADSSSIGIQITNSDPSKGIIEGNQLRNVSKGIDSQSLTESLVIRDNAVGSSGVGIEVGFARGLLVAGNDVVSAGGEGIIISNSTICTLTGNHVTATTVNTGGIALLLTHHCLIADNISSANTGSGIYLEQSNDNRLERNVANGNTLSGIWVYDGLRNALERNTTNGNLRYGIELGLASSLNRYGRNSAVGNGAGPPPPACTNGPGNCGTPDLCNNGVANISFGDNLAPGLPPC